MMRRKAWLLSALIAGCGGGTSESKAPKAAPTSEVEGAAAGDATAGQPSDTDEAPTADLPPSISPASEQRFAEGVQLVTSDVDGALKAFLAAADESEGNYLAHYNAGAIYERKGQGAEAENAYRRALKAKPDFGPAGVGLAGIAERRGDVAGAEQILREHPESSDALSALAQLLARQQKFDEARTLAIKALQKEERNAQAMLAMGMVYRRQKKYELATLALNQALEVAPSLGEAYNELGLVLLERDEKAQAVQAFERAAQASPYVASIHNNLGVLRNEVGAFKAAVTSLEMAVKLSPERSEYYLNLGTALRGDQRYVEAEAAYKKAGDAGSALALFNLGVLYLDNELGPDLITRFKTCISYLQAYKEKAQPTKEDEERIAEYIHTAEKSIENEEKRLAREKQRAEKEAQKRKQAEAEAQDKAKSDAGSATPQSSAPPPPTDTAKADAAKVESSKGEPAGAAGAQADKDDDKDRKSKGKKKGKGKKR